MPHHDCVGLLPPSPGGGLDISVSSSRHPHLQTGRQRGIFSLCLPHTCYRKDNGWVAMAQSPGSITLEVPVSTHLHLFIMGKWMEDRGQWPDLVVMACSPSISV